MSLNISQSLTYSAPTSVLDGKVNFVSFKPQKDVYKESETIDIKYSSNSEFAILSRSYHKFTINTTAVGTLSTLGGYAVLNQLQEQLSGTTLPVSRNHFLKCGVLISNGTTDRKTIETLCAKAIFNSSTGVATTVGGTIDVIIPFQCSFDYEDKIFPLAVCNGFKSTLSLNASDQVVSVGTYTISNFETVLCMIEPEPSYLQEISNGLNSGSTLKMPVKLTNSTTLYPNSALTQNLLVNPGYQSSLNSVSLVLRETPLTNSNKLKSFYIMLDSIRYPRNAVIKTDDRLESVYQLLAGYHTSFDHISVPDVSQVSHTYTFQSNGSFASGVAISNGMIEIISEYTSAPSSASMEVILNYSGYLEISRNSVTLFTDV